MNGKGFRLHQIKTEGFKGFTEGKTVSVNGKHVFILGPNSYGKSSLVEAIRWGLFGSTRRPGEVVANQSYAGSCRVELLLERGDGEWTLKRTLIRGVTGGSDADIVDKLGNSHPLREVLPQLESAPAGEGMHIVYAAQSAPLRRSAEDVSSFERTIYSYLGLTDVRVAISCLEKFIELQEAREKKLAEELDQKRNNIELALSQLTEQRGNIIKNPPWGAGSVPTSADTTSRIEQFIKELSTIMTSESTPVAGLELGSLISEAQTLVDRVSRAKKSDVENDLRGIVDKLKQGQLLFGGLSVFNGLISQVESEIASTEQGLARVLAGETLEALAKAVVDIERQVEKTALLYDIQKKAHTWLEQYLHDAGKQHCPVCEEEPKSENLIVSLAKKIKISSAQEKEIVNKKDALKLRYKEATQLAAQLNQLKGKHDSWQQWRDQNKNKIQNFLGSDLEKQDIDAALKALIEELDNARATLERQLKQADELHQERKRKLERLQEEVRFHRIQESLLEFQKKTTAG